MTAVNAYAAQSATTPLTPFNFERRDVGTNDVQIEILYCGVCHSDIHQARNEWGGSIFPMVPGHEIVGRITKVGSGVKSFNVGQLAGVGGFVDSPSGCKPSRRFRCRPRPACASLRARARSLRSAGCWRPWACSATARRGRRARR